MSGGKIVCGGCGRPMSAAAGARSRCMYSGGSPKEVHVMVVGPEVSDPAAKLDEMRRPAAQAMTPAERERLFDAAKAKLIGHIDAGRHEEALVAFDEALMLVRDPYLLLAKGQHLKALRRPGPALECLEEALAIDGSLTDAWFEKADILETLGHLPSRS